MKNLIATTAILVAIMFSTASNAQCLSVGDVKEVLNNGGFTSVLTHGGTFTFSKGMAIAQTVGSNQRHAPACYDATSNKLTYTLPGGGKATSVVE